MVCWGWVACRWRRQRADVSFVVFFAYLSIHLFPLLKLQINASWVASLYVAVINTREERGSDCVASLKTSFIGQTLYFSSELLSLHIQEKLIELCPGYDVFFFLSAPTPQPSRTQVLVKCPPRGFEIHFLCNYYFLSCFPLFPLPWLQGVFSFLVESKGVSTWLQASCIECQQLYTKSGVWRRAQKLSVHLHWG